MYQRKTRDIWVVQGYYYGRWEDVSICDSRIEGKADLKAYDENEPSSSHRLVKRRERK